ncbi:hypothetical protein VPHD24_0065 [Vibrio phage D24]
MDSKQEQVIAEYESVEYANVPEVDNKLLPQGAVLTDDARKSYFGLENVTFDVMFGKRDSDDILFLSGKTLIRSGGCDKLLSPELFYAFEKSEWEPART